MVRIKFFGEGNHDVGRHGESDPSPVQAFVKNILKNSDINDEFEWEANYIRKIPIHGRRSKPKTGNLRGLKARVDAAILHASKRKIFDAIVFVMDHDGYKNRIQEMAEGREKARKEIYYLPTALGLPKMEIESWLLSDSQCRRSVLGKAGGDDIGKIEETEKSKDNIWAPLYEKYKQSCQEPLKEHEVKLKLAQNADVNKVAKECPESFKHFIKEIEENLLTLFKDHN